MRLFRLMEACSEYAVCHTRGLTEQEASEMLKRHTECFPELDYWVEADDNEEQDEPRHYNERAVDGWEDIYSR
jgi:hypothetical protein